MAARAGTAGGSAGAGRFLVGQPAAAQPALSANPHSYAPQRHTNSAAIAYPHSLTNCNRYRHADTYPDRYIYRNRNVYASRHTIADLYCHQYVHSRAISHPASHRHPYPPC